MFFQTQTVSPVISLENRLANLVSEETIMSGDTITFFCEDTLCWRKGIYKTLRLYTHGENSPFVGDNRIMAYVQIFTQYGIGATYADVRTISKALKA